MIIIALPRFRPHDHNRGWDLYIRFN